MGLICKVLVEATLKPDFVPPDFTANDMRHHTVISEWSVADPSATTFSIDSRRELLRVGTRPSSYFHPFGDLQFNPNSQPGDDDYGLLYISGGDHGFINGRGAGGAVGTTNAPRPSALQRTDTLAGTMIRIDPRSASDTGGTKGLGDYTIPSINLFASDNDAGTLPEIYAYGFRNAHRINFDTDSTIYASSIGQDGVETVYDVQQGRNHGWSDREGRFINGLDTDDGGNGNQGSIFAPTPGVDNNDDFVYPVLEHLHTQGAIAIAGGVVYRGNAIPELRGKFVFGDLVTGDLFYADIDELKNVDLENILASSADFERLQLLDEDGNAIDNLRAFVGNSRVDMRLHLDADGEIYFSSKTEGIVGTFTAVPEPTTLALLGLVGTAAATRRQCRLPHATELQQ